MYRSDVHEKNGISEFGRRLRALRKELSLTQQEFADRLGIPRNNIAGYETGKRSPSEAAVSLICREFHVSEEYLRGGDGEMFAPRSDAPLDLLAKEYGLSAADLTLIEGFAQMPPEQRRVIADTIWTLAGRLQGERG